MKKNFLYLTLLAFILLIFKNYNVVLDSTIKAVDIWLYKVFPYLFIMIIINDLLIQTNFAKIFPKTSYYVFIMSLLSGTPTSAYIVKSLYQDGKITKEYANNALLFTYFCNPLFLYTILKFIFKNSFIPIKLMIIHYLSNIIIYLFLAKKESCQSKTIQTFGRLNLSNSISKSITTVSMVLGAITFYMVLSDILLSSCKFSSNFGVFFKGFLEVTQGLNGLETLSFSSKIKEIIALGFISFGGLSIHTQIKCILEETDINYKYFLIGRIWQVVISLFLLILFGIINAWF